MGLTPVQIEYLFEFVENTNNHKPNKLINGKVTKDNSFIDPKPEINKVINTLR
jgi:hypothetical protein